MLLLIIGILELCGVALPAWVWIVSTVLGGISTLITIFKASINVKEKF